MSLAVHHLLRPVRVPHPALQVIKDAKALVDIAQMEQAVGLIAEFILHILPVHPHHGHGAGQDQGGLVLVLYIQVGHIVDLVPLEELRDRVAGELFKIGAVQIDTRRGIRGAEVDGKRHPALQQRPHLKIQDRDRAEAQVVRHDGGLPPIDAVEEVGLLAVHAVEGIIADRRLPALHLRGFCDEQLSGLALVGAEIENSANLPAADQKGVGVHQLLHIPDRIAVKILHGDAVIYDELGAALQRGVHQVQLGGGKQGLQTLQAIL